MSETAERDGLTGPEPVTMIDLPAEPAFLPPWEWGDELRFRPDLTRSATLFRELDEAAEECRVALALALRHLPPFHCRERREAPIFDTTSTTWEGWI